MLKTAQPERSKELFQTAGNLIKKTDSGHLTNKEVRMFYINQEIKKHLSPFYDRHELSADSMDDGINRILQKGDSLVCREVHPEFWIFSKNLEILNIVVVESYEHRLTGQIKHSQDANTFYLHRLNSNYPDVEFKLSEVRHIGVIEYASR